MLQKCPITMTEALQVGADVDFTHTQMIPEASKDGPWFPVCARGRSASMLNLLSTHATTNSWRNFSPSACMHTETATESRHRKKLFYSCNKMYIAIVISSHYLSPLLPF